jgi:restriction system protein
MGYPEIISLPINSDYGADLEVRDTRGIVPSTLVVQAKRYRKAVRLDVVREVFGAMVHRNANGAIIFTTSWFPPSATAFAEGKPITLINGAKLVQLLKEHLDIDAIVDLNRDF